MKSSLTLIISSLLLANVAYGADKASKYVPEVKWDSQSLIIDGKRVMPAMGEVHYSRIPAEEWEAEVKKMKDGGLNIIATYVFWNHHEETEGQFDWSGQRNLRRFLEICKDNDLVVFLRLGPFCHGEVRNGGIPDFMFEKGCKLRSEDPVFLESTRKLYSEIYRQIEGLQWKDGGPIMAAQFDNEYRGHGSYLMALKKMAEEIGFDLPLYTRTGWPELATPVPYGEMVPLYGDYADGFWERSIEPTAGNYYKAFNFKSFRSSDAIATDQLDTSQLAVNVDNAYPYFTCELGGGMTTAYHRRPLMYPDDAYSLAIVKLGSGSNLLGYYMYHGGSNPDSRQDIYLNEDQNTPGTNYNDMPHKSYEFQAPIGEYGEINPHFYELRKLHLFMKDYGEVLAPMSATFPVGQDLQKGDDSVLRWSYRSLGDSAFVFINNYERLQNLTDKEDVQFSVCGVTFPSVPITIPAGTICHFPVNISGMDYATAQIVAKKDGKIYLQQIPGISTEISLGGNVYSNLTPKGTAEPVLANIYLLEPAEAGDLFLGDEYGNTSIPQVVTYRKLAEAGPARDIPIGAKGVAKQPEDTDFEKAAVYEIDIPKDRTNMLLDIEYVGDCARLYADGKLIADNFYNGRNFHYGLWRLPKEINKLEIRILPLSENMPIYFPTEADVDTPGEKILSITSYTTL